MWLEEFELSGFLSVFIHPVYLVNVPRFDGIVTTLRIKDIGHQVQFDFACLKRKVEVSKGIITNTSADINRSPGGFSLYMVKNQ